MKKKVAVFFGGRSPEHDVSIVTGLQVLQAIDTERYDPFPVYMAMDGRWFTGESLRERGSYLPDDAILNNCVELSPYPSGEKGRGALRTVKSSIFGKAPIYDYDIALPAFHGLIGEDGNMQGFFEITGVPYAGMRTMASALLMDKVATKYALQALDIPCLDYGVFQRPTSGYIIDKETIAKIMKPIGFPAILKPVHLGSSIGVAKVETVEEVQASLPAIFQYDSAAIVEPCVQNLVEYNVAVGAFGPDHAIITSAIERPKATEELLDFKQKYLSGGDGKTGTKSGSKTPGAISQGMLFLTRELNPDIASEMRDTINSAAMTLYKAMGAAGAPRIDFLCDSKTGELWLNEVNPIPGSFGYFLWEAAQSPLLFTELLSALLEQAVRENNAARLPDDPVPQDARLFKRSG